MEIIEGKENRRTRSNLYATRASRKKGLRIEHMTTVAFSDSKAFRCAQKIVNNS